MTLSTKILSIIIIILFGIILLQRCNKQQPKVEYRETVKVDTIYRYIRIKGDTVAISKTLIDSVPYNVYIKEYIPDTTNLFSLKQSYNKLYDDFAAKKTYKSKFTIDSLGDVNVIDTLQYNSLLGSRYLYDFKVKQTEIDKTVTKYLPPKQQLYAGIGIFGNKSFPIRGIQGSLLYKDRKDRMFEFNIKAESDAQLYYGIGTYWKIKFKN